MSDLFNSSSAVISPCGLYRYRLERQWEDGPAACWVMLNPSTADAEQDDPTIRRVMSFSRAWGYGRLIVVNLFAYRATDPSEMKRATADPVGKDNDAQILAAAWTSDRIVCAWGVDGGFRGRDKAVKEILKGEGLAGWCLGITKGGQPKHPLYLASATELIRFV